MASLLERLRAYEGLGLWLTLASIAMFVASLLLVPWLVARAPIDVFEQKRSVEGDPVQVALLFLRNALGAVLILLGIAMLVLPGQGLITIVVGLYFVDIPGKHALVLRIVRRPKVWQALCWLRARAGKPPFHEPP